MPATAAKLPGHLRNRCLAPTAVKLHFSAVPKPVRMPKAPESADPDAPKRKRGGQPGNSNRLKHGRFSAFAMPPAPPPPDPDAEDAARPWLLEEQLIDFGPRRRGAQPGNMNRMIHGQRSVRTRANNQRMKALIARGKAILAICNAIAAMAERLVAEREAAAAARHEQRPPETTFHAVPMPVRMPERRKARTFRARDGRRLTRLPHKLSQRPAAALRQVARPRQALPILTRARDAPAARGGFRAAQYLTLNRRSGLMAAGTHALTSRSPLRQRRHSAAAA